MSAAGDRAFPWARTLAVAIPPLVILGFCILTSVQSLQPKPDAAAFTVVYVVAGLAWLAAGMLEFKRPGTYRFLWVILLGVACRAVLLPFGPLFDNDIHRYLWDGHVAANGINPFLYAPASEHLTAFRTGYYGQIGFPEIGTIYPPFAQLVFLTAAKLHLTTPALFKLILIPFDVGTMVLIAGLLKRIGKPIGLPILYAWSPLILKEYFNSGHIDIVMMCLMLLALYLLFIDKTALAGVAIALSVMTKGVSIIVLPLLAKRQWSWLMLSFSGVMLALWLPYAAAGSRALGGASAYAQYWRFNDGLFYLLYRAEEAFRSHQLPAAPFAKALGVAALLVYLVYVMRRMDRSFESLIAACARVTCALLLLMPVVNPWYVCWLAPFLCLAPNRAMLALCLLCPLSYLYYVNNSFPEWIRLAEYGPVFLIFTATAIAARTKPRKTQS